MFKMFDLCAMIKKHHVAFLLGSIAVFIIGILLVIAPFASGAVLIWVIIGLIGILGIASIIKFIVPGQGNKHDVRLLLIGILVVLCVTAIILTGALGKGVVFEGVKYSSMEVMTVNILGFASIFFGVLATINNFVLLFNVGLIPSGQKGFFVFKSIFGIAIGVLTVIFPFFMFGLSILLMGIYLMIMSLITFIMTIKFW